MTKETKNTKPTTSKPATPAPAGTAAPRKKLTLNTTAFQKKLSSMILLVEFVSLQIIL